MRLRLLLITMVMLLAFALPGYSLDIRANLAAMPALRSQNLHLNIGKQVTIEGDYYDGSVPMIIDNIQRVHMDLPIPTTAYVPLTGFKLPVKWGDRVKITGTLEKPTAGIPHLQHESVVLRITDVSKQQILNKVAMPQIMPKFRPMIDPSKIKIIAELMKQPYAVLIAGGYDAANNHIRYWNDLSMMYSILVANGYPRSNIIVFYANGVARDGSMPVNYAATKANINNVFNYLAGVMNSNRTLYIMTNDHGTQLSGGYTGLCLWNHEVMSDMEFAAAVNRIANYKEIIVQMKQCFSGGFVSPLTKPKRIVMSSSTASQLSYSAPDLQHGEFTYWYMGALSGSMMAADTNHDGKVSILEAYNFARTNDRAGETPQYEGNGVVPFVVGPVPSTGEGALGATTFLRN